MLTQTLSCPLKQRLNYVPVLLIFWYRSFFEHEAISSGIKSGSRKCDPPKCIKFSFQVPGMLTSAKHELVLSLSFKTLYSQLNGLVHLISRVLCPSGSSIVREKHCCFQKLRLAFIFDKPLESRYLVVQCTFAKMAKFVSSHKQKYCVGLQYSCPHYQFVQKPL